MIKILFVCHGNICRSPMAEFLFKDMVEKEGLSKFFYIASAATSTEEIGNGVHHGTRKKLAEYGIATTGKTAIQLKKSDYEKYDFIIGMDEANIRNIKRICTVLNEPDKRKIYKMLEFCNKTADVADPWYTGNFDITYDDIYAGCTELLKHIKNNCMDKIRK